MPAHLGDLPGDAPVMKPIAPDDTWVDDLRSIAGPLASLAFGVAALIGSIALAFK